MNSYPNSCAKCRRPLGQSRGRPTRWCSPGCRTSGEAEARRLSAVLAKFEMGRAVDQLNGTSTERRDAVIADLERRLDVLCGVDVEGVES